jgi:hypothetical protein
MNETKTLPAPVIDFNTPATSKEPHKPHPKWEREYQAFQKLLPQLLETYRDKYVAIHEEKVVESGDDLVSVALRAYKNYGYVPILVDLVTDQPKPIIRLRRPGRLRNLSPS